jgi:hypothetical protein
VGIMHPHNGLGDEAPSIENPLWVIMSCGWITSHPQLRDYLGKIPCNSSFFVLALLWYLPK